MDQPSCRMGRRHACRLALAFLGAWAGTALAAASLSFDDALTLATSTTPAVLARQALLEAGQQAALPAGELPDPRLALGVENLPVSGPDRYSLVRDTMTMKRVALLQEVPNRAKREARVQAATAQVTRLAADQRLAVATAQRETAVAWIRRHTVEQQLRLLDALDDENRHFEQAVRAQFAAGRALATDVILPQQEAALLADRRDELVSQQVQAVAALQQWIGTAATLPLAGAPRDWPVGPAGTAGVLHLHPELQSLAAREQVLAAEVREAEAARQPDWSVELAFQRRGPAYGDMVSVQFSFDLPVFASARQTPRIAAKRAERASLQAEQEAMLREHAQALASDTAEYERLGRVLDRNRDTAQRLAREKSDLALAAYASGKAGLSEVINARREGLELQLRQVALEGERALVATRLHFVTQHGVVPGDAP